MGVLPSGFFIKMGKRSRRGSLPNDLLIVPTNIPGLNGDISSSESSPNSLIMVGLISARPLSNAFSLIGLRFALSMGSFNALFTNLSMFRSENSFSKGELFSNCAKRLRVGGGGRARGPGKGR